MITNAMKIRAKLIAELLKDLNLFNVVIGRKYAYLKAIVKANMPNRKMTIDEFIKEYDPYEDFHLRFKS